MRRALVVAAAVAVLSVVGCARAELRPLGVAVADDTGGWCAMFAPDVVREVEPGRRVALAFPQEPGRQAMAAQLASAQPGPCPTPFAQSRWEGYSAFRVELTDRSTAEVPWPAVAVVLDDAASPGDGGVGSATLRACLADEGMHFTLWRDSAGAGPERVWHEYYDLGAIVDPTCGPGENGRQVP